MLEELQRLLKQKRSKAYYAEQLNISVAEVEDLMKEIREGDKQSEDLNIEGNTYSYNIDKGTIEVSTYYDAPPTPEDVIRDHKIDITKWKLSAYYSKGKAKGWQVTALFKNIAPEEKFIGNFEKFLSTYDSRYTPVDKKEIMLNESYIRPVSLVLSLCDFHLGKRDRVLVPIETRIEQYKDTVDKLLYKTYLHHNIDEIVFVVGNDLFQTDTVLGTTVKQTKVDDSMSWHEVYEIGFDLMVSTISKLKQFCNRLNIILTPGNHSESKEYYLTHALEVFFKKEESIIFNRTSDKYKCYTYGETALFFNHGDNIQDRLPLMFAQTFSKEWGATKYHEIILGDRHHNSEKTFKSQGEAQGVRMRILPSLTNIDQWHYDNLFTNAIQAGIALVYDKETGKCSEFEHRI